MTKTALALTGAVVLVGCTRSVPVPRKQDSTAPPRHFSEKLQCASVGERWEKNICSDKSTFCGGWWAYNARRDTCVGVFVQTSFRGGKQFQILSVYDMLTGVELEPMCSRPSCDVDAAQARWILGKATS